MKTRGRLFVWVLLTTIGFGFVPPKDKGRYVATMEQAIKKLDTLKTKEQLVEAANLFERIGQAEPGEWLPNYWAAYAFVQATGRETDKTRKDPLLDKADALIEKAAKQNNNDELLVLRAISAQSRLPVDPMNRWMKYGPVIGSSLEQAKKMNPGNPRVDLVLGQNLYFTPEAYGGGKKNALAHFQSAHDKFVTFAPASSIAPRWGSETATYFLAQCQVK